ncbi:MAG: anaerobic glycerol-3-phosphate dehydrogenase subunit B [Bacteroidales bacterium]|nr:anaerobic glycerol-3-phosphate dehydrogenase subunit B [Bacteroidales bacterium]
MRFDTIIVGGGMSSLVCGIKLQKAGKKCLIVSAGQNALHFSSGTFGLLAKLPDGTAVTNPLSALDSLPSEHPYSKMGSKAVAEYAAATPKFFEDCGVELHPAGNASGEGEVKNGYRITGMGTMKPAWLAMKDVALFESKDEVIGSKALIINFAGFLDFNARFIAEGLEKKGLECKIERVVVPEVEILRKNPSEMRSVNIARVVSRESVWKEFAHMVRDLLKGEDVVVLPEVFGLVDPKVPQWLREMIPAKVLFIGTMPPSVPGIRAQIQLKKAFEAAGGTFLMGDEVLDPEFDGSKVVSVRTVNLGSMRLQADSFVLASGNLFGKGLVASPLRVVEPVFGLDVIYPEDRNEWYDKDFANVQNYIGFGVRTGNDFRPLKDGKTVENLYVIGSELGGCNPLAEGCGAGVAIFTAMNVADKLM